MTMTTASMTEASVHESPGLPKLGIRNYWYPALASWRLRSKPKCVRMLGEDIVLFRDGGQIHALADRCAHRGAKLSMGKCLYPGSRSITCPYHGWTYDGGSGKVVAKLVEGPNAPIPPKARVKVYPVRELRGAIWIFVGDMEAVPLNEDLPDCIAEEEDWHIIWNWRTYQCDWRLLSDNLTHDQHAPFLHRTAPELFMKPIFPHATRNFAEPLENGKGIGHRALDGITTAEYPGLGPFPPKSEWYRLLPATGRGREIDPVKSPAVVKYGIRYRHMSLLPATHLIGRPSGDFFTVRWILPVDEKTTILYNFNCFRRQSALKTLGDRLGWLVWKSWAHDWLFSDQDKWIVEKIDPDGPELLSRTDVGVAAWRRFCQTQARKPIADKAAVDVPASPRTIAA